MYEKTEAITSTSALQTLPLLMTVKQAAEVTGVSQKHIRDQFNAGTIKGCRIGQAIRINRDQFLSQCGLA